MPVYLQEAKKSSKINDVNGLICEILPGVQVWELPDLSITILIMQVIARVKGILKSRGDA